MKLALDRERWLALIERPCAATSARSTIPILSFLALRVRDGRLIATGTDIITTATRHVEIDHPDESICVEAKRLLDVIKSMPKGATVTLETTDSAATLKSGRSRFKLETADAGDYPNRAYDAPNSVIAVDAATLLAQIEFVDHAHAVKDVRYFLNGVHLLHSTGTLAVQASDGHRCAFSTRQIESGDAPEFSVIVDHHSVPHLTRFIADASGSVTLGVHNTRVELIGTTGSIACQLIQGKYPDLQRVVPRTSKIAVVVERSALVEIANRVSMASDDRHNGVQLSVFGDRIKLVSFKLQDEVGADELSAVVSPTVGDDESLIDIGVNPVYLVEAVSAFEESEVILRFNAAADGIRVDAGAARDPFIDGECCVIMPMRI